jgi:hypothetical protein
MTDHFVRGGKPRSILRRKSPIGRGKRGDMPTILVHSRAILVISTQFGYISLWRACRSLPNKLLNRLN